MKSVWGGRFLDELLLNFFLGLPWVLKKRKDRFLSYILFICLLFKVACVAQGSRGWGWRIESNSRPSWNFLSPNRHRWLLNFSSYFWSIEFIQKLFLLKTCRERAKLYFRGIFWAMLEVMNDSHLKPSYSKATLRDSPLRKHTRNRVTFSSERSHLLVTRMSSMRD